MTTLTQPSPELLRASDAARMCAMGRSTWDRLTAASKVPAPIRLGSTPMWNRRELLAWLDHGCPDRDAWATIWTRLRSKNQPR